VYVYECAGRVVKTDASGQKLLGQWDLQSLFRALIPPGNRDGCYLNGLIYDTTSARLFTVVPREPVVAADGTREYLLLAVDVPVMRVASSMPLPQASAYVPVLQQKNGAVVVRYQTPDVEPKEMTAAYSPSDLRSLGVEPVRPDTDVVTTDPRFALAKAVDRAGSLELVVFPEAADHTRRFAVVRAASGDEVAAFTAPRTSVNNIHLSHDGSIVLVEEVSPGSVGLTGRLVPYDVQKRRTMPDIRAPDLVGAEARFLCIAPSAEYALYSVRGALSAVNLSTGAIIGVAAKSGLSRNAAPIAVDKTSACVVADR
jgi:hypothetical protein